MCSIRFFLLLVLIAGSVRCGAYFECNTTTPKCGTCADRVIAGGLQYVTIDFSGCKGSDISWACCRSVGCSRLMCDGVLLAPSSSTKCDETLNQTFSLSADATTISVQYHDGVLCGNVACGSGRESVCCGGSGTSTNCLSGVCNKVIDLSTCPTERPECSVDADCPAVEGHGACAVSVCDAGKCKTQFKPSTTQCRAAAGDCDTAEYCTGHDVECPADAFLPPTAQCRASLGACDVAEFCTGASASCPANAFVPATTVCRQPAGDCDVAEYCTGDTAECPVNVLLPPTTLCRAVAGSCDVAEYCTGVHPACPSDLFLPSSTVCRDAAGCCDAAEYCSGSAAACPLDAKRAAGSVCRPAVVAADGTSCDVAETCDGTSDYCPRDGFRAAGAVCRGPADSCDVAESCSGNSSVCSRDLRKDSGYTMKCGTTCYLCGVPESQLGYSAKQSVGIIGGCTIGNCRAVVNLPWPSCATQCIANSCIDGKALSNSAVLQCEKSTGQFGCTGKLEGNAVLDGVCATDGWFPYVLPAPVPIPGPSAVCAAASGVLQLQGVAARAATDAAPATAAAAAPKGSSASTSFVVLIAGSVVGVAVVVSVAAMLIVRSNFQRSQAATLAPPPAFGQTEQQSQWARRVSVVAKNDEVVPVSLA